MSDIERDLQFDSDDERAIDPDLTDDRFPDVDVHADPEAPEADVLDQLHEVPLDDPDDAAL
jgi:hypothetical protein